MSSDLAIRVEGLSKAYTIRHQQADHVTLAQTALDRAKHPFRRNEREQFWALQDVSFEVKPGEVIGLIGRNGAGKSTLLKVLTRITAPTSGRIDLWGRVGSLLEVGTGFHPELTGRENTYLNGSILGMTRKEIDRQFDAIVDFAGVEKFLDTPVKRYSSGMYVRLAFAVAAHLETEILLLDEVLAVGDAEFQKKCLGKIGNLAHEGRTVLFVSHNASLISKMTHRGILLKNGYVEFDGPTESTIAQYRSGATDLNGAVYIASDADRGGLHLGRELEICTAAILNNTAGLVPADSDLDLELTLQANADVTNARVHVGIVTNDGVTACGGLTPHCLTFAKGERRSVTIRLPAPHLAPGQYGLNLSVGSGDHFSEIQQFDAVGPVYPFEVSAPMRADGAVGSFWRDSWGLTRLPTLQLLDSADGAADVSEGPHAAVAKLERPLPTPPSLPEQSGHGTGRSRAAKAPAGET